MPTSPVTIDYTGSGLNPATASAGNAWTKTITGNQSGANAFSASPTVVTDANIRESKIPETVSTSNGLVGNNNSPANKTTGQDNNGTSNNSDTSSGDSTDYSHMSYEDIYNSAFNKVANSPVDPTTTAILKNITDMKASSDAATATQLDAITKGYTDARQIEERASQSTTGQLRGLLESSGAYRTGSGAGILGAKAHSDIMNLSQLTNQESAAKAAIIKAQNENNFQLMDKSNTLLKDIQDRKYKLASDIAAGITKKNEDDRTYALNVQKFNHDSAKDNATLENEKEKLRQGAYEFRDLKDEFGNTIGTSVYDKATGRTISNISSPNRPAAPGSNGPLNPVGLDSTGNPDKSQQESYLKTLPPPLASEIQGLINYTSKPPNNSSKAGEKLNSYAHMADPTYDESQYATRQKVQQSYTSGKDHTNIVSLNTSINHVGELAKDFAKLDNKSLTSYNSIANWWDSQVGKGDITKVVNDLNAVGGELAKTYKGTAGTDTEVANIEKGISPKSSPAQVKGFIESALSLLGGRVNALGESYSASMGKDAKRELLVQPTADAVLSKFKNAGYNIDVPGVKFTDPVAFYNSSPENKALMDNIRAKFPELTPAQALQIAQ